MSLVSRSRTLSRYRHRRLATLIFCALALLGTGPLAHSEESNTDWPEPLYFPQSQSQPATPAETPTSGSPAGTSATTSQAQSETEKGIWPFRKHTGEKGKAKSATGTHITQVGPKDPPPSPYPLLRLSMPIDTGSNRITPGIYLVKPSLQKPSGSAVSQTIPDTFLLTRQNKPVLLFKVHAVSLPDDNLKLTGTPSPLTKTNPNAAKIATAETEISPDLKSLIIVLKEGETRLESDAFPISTDQRHILNF